MKVLHLELLQERRYLGDYMHTDASQGIIRCKESVEKITQEVYVGFRMKLPRLATYRRKDSLAWESCLQLVIVGYLSYKIRSVQFPTSAISLFSERRV